MAPIALHDDANGFADADRFYSHTATVEGDHGEKDNNEPIAVIGFSLKFPQEATTPEAFWQMLCDKKCSMTEWPRDRLNVDAFYHPDSKRPDTVGLFDTNRSRYQLTLALLDSFQRGPFPQRACCKIRRSVLLNLCI